MTFIALLAAAAIVGGGAAYGAVTGIATIANPAPHTRQIPLFSYEMPS